MKRFMTFTLVAALVAFAGCSEEESTAPTTTAPTIPVLQMTTSITNTTDFGATLSQSTIYVFSSLMSMTQLFAALPPTSANGTYTWSFSGGGETITMTAVRQSDGSYVWTWKFTGVINDVQVTNFTLWSGTSSADGKTGSFAFYEPGVTGASEDVTWSVAANGTITATWKVYTDGVVTFKAIGVVNTDKSGTLDIYDNGTTLTFHSAWNAAGAGTWTYTPIGGTPSNGSWN
jgi:hypothetical protein